MIIDIDNEIEHLVYAATEAENIDSNLSMLIANAALMLGSETVAQELPFRELVAASLFEETPEEQKEVVTLQHFLDGRQRIVAALQQFSGWNPVERSRIHALCQLIQAVIDEDGTIRSDTA